MVAAAGMLRLGGQDMRKVLLASAFAVAFVAWVVPAWADDVGAPPPPNARMVANCCPEEVCCNPGFAVSAGAIFAKVRRPDTVYGAVEDGLPPAGAPIDSPEVEFDYEIGFRAGVSYTLCGPCCWDFSLTGTFLSTDADDTTTVAPPGLIIPPAFVAPPPFAPNTATSEWDEDYLVIDLDAGYTFCGECLSARVFAGFRYLDIDEEVTNTYSLAGQGISLVNDNSTDMTAIGLHAGVEPKWKICRGFGLYGRFGGGLLIANFEYDHTETFNPAPTAPGIVIGTLQKEVEDTISMLEAAVGLYWESDRLFGGCVGLRVKAGYEITRYDFLDFRPNLNFPIGIPSVDVQDSSYTVDGFFLTVDVLF
jgi:hypothetical protein